MTRVAIIIVNWNGILYTKACLHSIKKFNIKDVELTTIVVDNGSTDDSVSQMKKEFPWVVLLPLSKNCGYTGGNNEGIKYALSRGANYLWLLNNDTIVSDQALSALLSAGADIGGSKIFFEKGFEYHKDRYEENDKGKVIWYAGGVIDWQNMYASHRGVDEVDRGQYNKIEETSFVTGCSMMVKRKVFERIGLLDEKFFAYLEDLDFCLRAKQAGFHLLYVPTSVVWHKNAGSTDRPGNELQQYYLTRNRILVGIRYAPVRTKLALLKESIKFMFSGGILRKAVVDASFGRFGKQYIWNQKNIK